MSVYAMLFREHFGTRVIGVLLGVFSLTAAVGMGAGGMMGGLLYTQFGSYTVPFLISIGTGILATFLALTFPSPRQVSAVTPPHVAWQAS